MRGSQPFFSEGNSSSKGSTRGVALSEPGRKIAAEAKARLIRERGVEPTKDIESGDLALLALIKKQFGNDAAEVIRNLDFARKTIGGIPEEKRVDLETACTAFVERQRKENRNRRTIYSDRQALKYLCQFAGREL